jgi:hypothetical protein
MEGMKHPTWNSDSLIGAALQDTRDAMLDLAYDGEGGFDCHEADHQYDQLGLLEDELEETCDVAVVFAEESLRWAQGASRPGED